MSKLKQLKPRLQTINNKRVETVSDSWRSNKSSTRRGYGYKWQQARKRFLNTHPLCVYCKRDDRITVANVVDHIVPHRGDMKLFWDVNNWQSLCESCHSSVKQREESKS